MTDRSVLVRLRADVGDYIRGMVAAKKATDDVTSSGSRATGALASMVKSARDNRSEWETTGKVLLTAGAAITALGAAALKTGIEYNTVQQTSRAALTTLLGTVEAANAQMDKLDEFARTSPFAKQVFINAQRQMLGFGIEAKKVIPYLDAIQNAVAATGGSNEDIKELTRIFSQVRAAQKITAVDLMQFGQRGVDAAALIGSQMGKTGAQIRQEITSGTLDAGRALDALALGMQARFGGAAANVKTTFLGAVDRVKAAWRDLSSDLAAPFVDPQGGGLAVEWLNDLADSMRAFQDLPEPIKVTAVALAGLTGAALLAVGAFLSLAPRAVEVYDALGRLGPVGATAKGAIKDTAETFPIFARNATIAVAAIMAANAAGQLLTSTLGDVSLGANEAEAQIRALATSGANLEQLFGDLKNSWWQGTGPFGDDAAGRFRAALDQIADPSWFQSTQASVSKLLGLFGTTDVARYGDRLKQYGDTLSAMATQDLPMTVEAFKALAEAAGGTDDDARQLLETMPALRDTLIGIADGAGLGTDDATLLKIALGELVPVAKEGALGLSSAAAATRDYAAEQEAAADALAEWMGVAADASARFIDLGDAYQASIDQSKAWAEAQADATETSKDSWEDFYDGVSVSADGFIAQLQAQVDAQQNWQTNMLDLAGRVRDGMTGSMADAGRDMLDELMRLGPEGAAQVELLAGMTDDELSQVVALWSQKGEEAATGFNNQMAQIVNPVITLQTSTEVAQQQIDRFIRDNSGRTIFLNAAGQTVGFQMGPGTMRGWASGGYTGDIGTGDVAGVVHGKEFVVNARATAMARPWLEALNRAVPGYAAGGYVQPQYMSSVPSGTSGVGPSLAGLELTGTLDTPWGPATVRGIVRDELSAVARSSAGMRQTPGRLR